MQTYKQHDPNNLTEGWEAVKTYAKDAKLIAYDGCHKIYLAMDDESADDFRDDYDCIFEKLSPKSFYEIVKEWYEDSCGLRFVNAVWDKPENPNDGFVTLIAQFAE